MPLQNKTNLILKYFRKGQGVVESVFAIGVLGLIMGGAVILILWGISNRKDGFDRRKAVGLANMVIEQLVAMNRNRPEAFWKLENLDDQSRDDFEGYIYSVGFTNITGNANYPNCGVGKTDCAEAVVKVDWEGKNLKSTYFNRFFSKNE